MCGGSAGPERGNTPQVADLHDLEDGSAVSAQEDLNEPRHLPTPVTTILFDFFGTLVDYSASRSEQGYSETGAVLRAAGVRMPQATWLAAWEEVFADFDRRSQADLSEFGMRQVAVAFLHEVGAPVDDRLCTAFTRAYLREWNTGVTDIAGLVDVLDGLARDHRLAIVSNTHDPSLVPDHLDRLGIRQLFDDVVLSIDVGRRKPHPAVYRAALDRLGAAASRTLFVGDTPDADYHGPRAVGMRAVLVGDRPDPAVRTRLGSVLDLPTHLATAATLDG